jgi:hypothetical protein
MQAGHKDVHAPTLPTLTDQPFAPGAMRDRKPPEIKMVFQIPPARNQYLVVGVIIIVYFLFSS